MEISKDLFDKIAHLARLNFSEEERESMMVDMQKILSWVEKLEELDTEGVEALTNMAREVNVVRKDEVGEHLEMGIIKSNAPQTQDGFIKVPKVID